MSLLSVTTDLTANGASAILTTSGLTNSVTATKEASGVAASLAAGDLTASRGTNVAAISDV